MLWSVHFASSLSDFPLFLEAFQEKMQIERCGGMHGNTDWIYSGNAKDAISVNHAIYVYICLYMCMYLKIYVLFVRRRGFSSRKLIFNSLFVLRKVAQSHRFN